MPRPPAAVGQSGAAAPSSSDSGSAADPSWLWGQRPGGKNDPNHLMEMDLE